ncbi:MAG: S1/P1 Nuclease [Candidatus Eremiobacteraeota bacterium]|nr:S1/P1 Nuclease [Candidatus Eremiobacteraeota bacterium]NNM92504.1 S1/P1 Nuclease [Candidatus Eremiobacteraeota bacterium]
MKRPTTLHRMLSLLVLAALAFAPLRAGAWGEKGHEIINDLAAANLPSELPAFARTRAARWELRYLGPEMDRLKGSGRSWDADRDPGHYLDIGDDGKIAGVVSLAQLPASMSAYEVALLAAHTTPYRVGYLPYSIADGWEQLRTDFALWRVLHYEAAHAPQASARASFAEEARLRATLTLRDIGVWGHFVADGSQPLHVTTHFNGWGSGPNPEHFPALRGIHAQFESTFVDRFMNLSAVQRDIPAYVALDPQHRISQARLLSLIARYLRGTNAAVVPLYRIAAAGGFTSGSTQARAFTATQLARGATMLRNLIAYAWEDSLNERVGYPAVAVRAVLAGRAIYGP